MNDTSDAPNKLKYTKLLIKSYISTDVDFIINFDSIEQRKYIYIDEQIVVLTISTFHFRTLSSISIPHILSYKIIKVITLNLQCSEI